MKKSLVILCAAALAAPLAVTAPAVAQDITVQFGSQRDRMDNNRHWNDQRRWDRRAEDRRFHNGYRGYRERRAGYRYHDGWWFPPAAFALGAIIGGAIANDPPPRQRPRVRGVNAAHVDWCYDRWRSYRASDNTYQPFNGPRRQCVSPYG